MIETHYLANTDPDDMGPVALCDVEAEREEAPRAVTLSSILKREVTCPDCLKHLEAL